MTGDLAHDRWAETYHGLRDLLGEYAGGALPLAGNHDRADALREAFPTIEGSDGDRISFCTDVGGWRLVGLDTHVRGRQHGFVGERQLAWLERVLDGDRPALLFMHHPPVRVGTFWLDWWRLRDARELGEVISRKKCVKALFHGHVHMANEGELAGVRVLGTPSTVFQFMAGAWIPRKGPANPGYRVINLDRDVLHTTVSYLGVSSPGDASAAPVDPPRVAGGGAG
jgi:3',5'-cyclic-AMP phosphodiesterase